MTIILPNIFSLLQHIETLRKEPESYRPKRCPGCRHTTIWCHGCYTRKADENDTLNPVPIPRFYCPECDSTCSVLPECIPPRSWYLWKVVSFCIGILSLLNLKYLPSSLVPLCQS